MTETTDVCNPIYINLYNFEDQKFENSRYVLTSPCSLEACDECHLKPADLLYKPLSEFQDELDDNVPFEEILILYNTREADRLEKLRLCREKRIEIVDSVANCFDKSSRSSCADDDHGNLSDDKKRLNPADERTKMAIQGERFRSTIKRDYKRKDEKAHRLQFRGLDISEAEKADSEKSEKENTYSRRSRTMTPASSQRSVSSRSTLLDRSMTSSLDRSVTSSSLNKSLQSAHPIQDRQLRKNIGGSDLAITSKDQKILACLMRKEEDDLRMEKIRRLAHTAWENAYERTKRRQERLEMERRARVVDLNLTRENIRLEREALLHEDVDTSLTMMRCRSAEREARWEKSYEKIQEQSVRKLEEKKRHEMARKKSQEERRLAREKLIASFQETVNECQLAAMSKAGDKKEAQIQEKLLKLVEKNKKERETQQKRLEGLSKQEKDLEETVRSSLEYKHRRAEENIESLGNKRNREIRERRATSEERQKHAKAVIVHKDKVMDSYLCELTLYQKMKEDKAVELHQQTIEQKRHRAAMERDRWQQLQMANIKSVQRSEISKKRETLDSIEFKDLKSQRIQDYRDQAAFQLRTLAYNSQILRDQLKERYSKDSFDKKVQKVELDVKLGLGGI